MVQQTFVLCLSSFSVYRFSVKLATEFQCANDNDGDVSCIGKMPFTLVFSLGTVFVCMKVC